MTNANTRIKVFFFLINKCITWSVVISVYFNSFKNLQTVARGNLKIKLRGKGKSETVAVTAEFTSNAPPLPYGIN